ncbi:MAG: TonB-dependent receptor [Bacteroidetes bacterium]|nr:TonB-dependent receptor [Bacteroidota bacterium]
MNLKLQATILILMLTGWCHGQVLTQTLRGTVIDKVTHTPLPGAIVVITDTDPLQGTSTDVNGVFKITNVPVGKHSLKATLLGYTESYFENMVVNAGKESVITILLEEQIVQHQVVEVSGTREKNKPLNEMSLVSARTFSVEETQRFAAAVNDPARMAVSFAGVMSTDDGNNLISIRGNNPNGLLWRMEGAEIPNPNHFSTPGNTAGGGISILSSQLLSTSDFMTGAFPAEYNNALSGVFDLKLRKGNNEKRENTIQAGFLGIDLATEGPFKRGYAGSYLINYRYSTLSLIGKLGVNIGDATTNFQDLSFNAFLPTTKFGNISLFGFGGLSDQNFKAKKDSSEWQFDYNTFDWKFISNTGAVGLTHVFNINSSNYIKTTIVYGNTTKEYEANKLDLNYEPRFWYDENFVDTKITVGTSITSKFNSRSSLKSGINYQVMQFKQSQNSFQPITQQKQNDLSGDGNTSMIQSYAQFAYRANERATVVTGLSINHFGLNNETSVEPRASVKYDITERQSLSVGYGLHSQSHPLGVYFVKTNISNDTTYNKKLKMSKSHHLVLSYDIMLNRYLHIKPELYYQHLYDVPVGVSNTSTYSLLNMEYVVDAEALANKGIGKNTGMEITLEQYMHHNFYFLLAGSLYDSKYKTQDGKWYNTRFNTNYSLTGTCGYETKPKAKRGQRVFGINAKFVFRGGLNANPIDREASMAADETVYDLTRPFSVKQKDYFRIDTKFSMKRNRGSRTTTWSLDFQNTTNRKNVYGEYYEPKTNTFKTIYQTPLIPILSFKVDF